MNQQQKLAASFYAFSRISIAAAVVGGVLLAGNPAAAQGGGFIDAVAYASPVKSGMAHRWYEVSARLSDAFDDVCGDTFCEGDYPNLTSLSWRCSVQPSTGALGACAWTFAGSAEFVDAATGAVEVESKVVTCAVPLHTHIDTFVEALLHSEADDSSGTVLRRALPGLQGTLYDILSACL